jgi:3'-phosphoadenosine 5'-phosphosulfate sulfotransferase (PAPS reductase)/FAD synthetase
MTFEAEDLVKQAIERHKGTIGVACSFGKDSMVVLQMALKHDKNIPVLFANTGVEFPETIEFKNRMIEEWDLNIHETKPIKSFWTCITDYGFPVFRGKGTSRSPKCCIYTKEKPMMLLQKDLGIVAIFTGLMAEESRQRKLTMMRYDHKKAPVMWHDDIEFCGQRWWSKHDGIWKYHPIAYWSEADVLNYTKQNNIPLNSVYTKWNGIYKRCGCLPCPAYLDWEKKLPKTHPKLYLTLKKLQEPTQRRIIEQEKRMDKQREEYDKEILKEVEREELEYYRNSSQD